MDDKGIEPIVEWTEFVEKWLEMLESTRTMLLDGDITNPKFKDAFLVALGSDDARAVAAGIAGLVTMKLLGASDVGVEEYAAILEVRDRWPEGSGSDASLLRRLVLAATALFGLPA